MSRRQAVFPPTSRCSTTRNTREHLRRHPVAILHSVMSNTADAPHPLRRGPWQWTAQIDEIRDDGLCCASTAKSLSHVVAARRLVGQKPAAGFPESAKMTAGSDRFNCLGKMGTTVQGVRPRCIASTWLHPPHVLRVGREDDGTTVVKNKGRIALCATAVCWCLGAFQGTLTSSQGEGGDKS